MVVQLSYPARFHSLLTGQKRGYKWLAKLRVLMVLTKHDVTDYIIIVRIIIVQQLSEKEFEIEGSFVNIF